MSIPVSAPTAYHGVVTTATGITGLFQSAACAQSAQEVAALDGSGNTKNFEVFDFKNDVTMDVTYPTGAPTAALGDVITVDGYKSTIHNGAYILMGMTETQSNVDFTKYNFTMRRFQQNSIPAVSV